MLARTNSPASCRFPRAKSNLRRRRQHLLEAFEDRTLLSTTLFVTAPGGLTDATHFQTLQSALAVANTGDTIMLQNGFAAGTFAVTTLSQPATAGSMIIRTLAPLDVGDVFSIGSGGSDPVERGLVTAVQQSELGDYILSLATPLTLSHTGSLVNAATNPTVGISMGITLSGGDAGAVLPFNLEIWKNATGVTLSSLTLTSTGANTLLVDGHGNTVTNSTISKITLQTGSNSNSFSHNTIASLKAAGTGDSNGHDSFQSNTFTGRAFIIGNSTTPTADSFEGNTFTIASGEALHLENASGTSIVENTFTDADDGTTVLLAHNSDNLVIRGNHITTTGSQSTGMNIYSDGAGSASADIRDNVITTTDGTALYLAKYASTSALDVRVQGNDLTGNAMGVYVFGDGSSAGNVDVGGGSSRFGSSEGHNLFNSFTTSDAGHFAVGLFDTTSDFVVHADSNFWGVDNPLNVVADTTHTTLAMGTGVITAANPNPLPPAPDPDPAPTPDPVPPTVTETLTETVKSFTLVQGQQTCRSVARLVSNVAHLPTDFTVTINWGDGTTSTGKVVPDGKAFSVLGSHAYSAGGSYTITVSALTSTGVSASATGSATVSPRAMKVSGTSFSVDQSTGNRNGQVGLFSDNLPCARCNAYLVTITWSDGMTTRGKLERNWDGSSSIRTSRSFPAAGTLTGTITVATSDGLFSATGTFTATVNPKLSKGPKAPPLASLLRSHKSHD